MKKLLKKVWDSLGNDNVGGFVLLLNSLLASARLDWGEALAWGIALVLLNTNISKDRLIEEYRAMLTGVADDLTKFLNEVRDVDTRTH